MAADEAVRLGVRIQHVDEALQARGEGLCLVGGPPSLLEGSHCSEMAGGSTRNATREALHHAERTSRHNNPQKILLAAWML
eukprot:11812704-Alexandrium_andersonii.AAC.1